MSKRAMGLMWGFSVGMGVALSIFVHPVFMIGGVFALICWLFSPQPLSAGKSQ